jgi:preprotein translocase SecF subunit
MSKNFRLIPDNTKFDFMRLRVICFALSGLAILATLVLVPLRGLNLGIDFAGGFLIEVETPEAIDIAKVRAAMTALDVGNVEVQGFGQDELNRAVIRAGGVEGEGLSAEQQQQVTAQRIREGLTKTLGEVKVLRTETVGPKVSGELFRSGAIALGVAITMMLIYIWVRFEWQFGVAAIVALIHDVILTVGVLCLLQIEFNLTIVAALLALIGYSINDTVVVFDRVREDLRKYKKVSVREVVNIALNKTLARTLLTSGTTLISLFAIYLFGGEVLKGFSFALIWGIFVGTYSSIFVASALLVYTGVRRDSDEQIAKDRSIEAARP